MAALCSVFVVSCTSTTDPIMQLGLAPGAPGMPAAQGSAGDAGAMTLQASAVGNSPSGGIPVPAPRPGAEQSPGTAAAYEAPAEATGDTSDAATTASAEQKEPATTAAEDGGNNTATVASSGEAPADAAEDAASSETAEQVATSEAAEEAAASKRRGFLSAFFSPTPARVENPVRLIERQPEPQSQEETKPVITLASLPADEGSEQPDRASLLAGSDALPGVRKGGGLFEIKHASGSMSDDGNLDLYEDVDSYQVASAAGLARLAPNGLIKQRDSVDVSCFKPSLLRVLKTIEHRYNKKVMVTSGYRSPSHNRRVRGARKSLHMYCAAADIQVEGVSKWELARFVRAMPGRGGVGTYCHTNSVHVDVGPERDWNWRCRRRK